MDQIIERRVGRVSVSDLVEVMKLYEQIGHRTEKSSWRRVPWSIDRRPIG